MATIFIVETPNGVELKRGFRKLTTARKWAYANGNPYGGNRVMIASVTKERGKKYHGMMTFPGMFTQDCVWIPEDNPKNVRFLVKKDGSITRK